MNEGGSYGAGNPQWSPDGAYIYSDTDGPGLNEDLYLSEAACGSNMRINLTNSPEAEFCPTWSPDGMRLAACVVSDISDVVVYDVVLGGGGIPAAVVSAVNLTATGLLQGAFSTEIDWANASNRIAVRADNDI